MAAAGWLWLSECTPETEVGFGVVPAGDAVTDGAGVALPAGEVVGAAGLVAVCGAGLVTGAAMGPAGAGFFWASSATVNSIALSIGILATPFALSAQAYVVRAFMFSFCAASSFSARTLARFAS